MSTKDFYNAVTPGSSITHGTGLISESDYTKVTDAEIHSDALFLRCEVPVPNSILNKVKNDLIQRKMIFFLLIQYTTQHTMIVTSFQNQFQIQRQGLITYTDFCFMMNILATPYRYLDIAFLAFDITGDGAIHAKVGSSFS